jgi:hypothetical protein
MPNPTGINSFNRFSPEPAYGEKIQQRQLEAVAPVPQNPALNAPRRAQRSGQKPQPVAPPTPAPQEMTPQAWGAQAWGLIAQIPGIDPLAAQFAARARD